MLNKMKPVVMKYRIEIALLLGLAVATAFYIIPVQAQAQLSDKMVRLHILANSDSDEDQSLKLIVRDRLLAQADDVWQSQTISDETMSTIQVVAQQAVLEQGALYPVTVTRERMYFDTRHYETFSLPAGEYDAVRVLIGEGEGKNWWCVLFPPLCLSAAEGELEAAAQQANLWNNCE